MALRQFPYTTWMRIARVIEGTQTTAVLIGDEHISRSPGGVTISLDAPAGVRGTWAGVSNRARFLKTLEINPRVVTPHVAREHVSTSHVAREPHVARRTSHVS